MRDERAWVLTPSSTWCAGDLPPARSKSVRSYYARTLNYLGALFNIVNMGESGVTWAARVEPTLDEKLQSYQDQTGLSKSETVRELLRKGVEPDEAGRSNSPPLTIDYLMRLAPLFTTALLIAAGLYVFTPYLQSLAFLVSLAVATFFVNAVPLRWYGNRGAGL